MSVYVIALADKTVVSITGLDVQGLEPREIEAVVEERTGKRVRVIGVTGDRIDMDVYGLAPEEVLRDEAGIVRAVSAVQGIRATEVAEIRSARRPAELTVQQLKRRSKVGCPGERWQAGEAGREPRPR